MERREGRIVYYGPGFRIQYRESDPAGTVEGTGPDEIDLTYGFIMSVVLDGVFDERQVNYVNCL
jgi:hypothetical protein